MPGLRHAHTLQQLRDVIEYSPPGEYLNNNIDKKSKTKRNKQSKSKTRVSK